MFRYKFLVSSFSASKLPARYGWLDTKRNVFALGKKKFRVLIARCKDDRVEQLRVLWKFVLLFVNDIIPFFFTGFLHVNVNINTEMDRNSVKLSKK